MKNLAATLLVFSGIVLFAFGSLWADPVLDLLPQNKAGPWLELFVPFLPMALISAGALLYRQHRRSIERKS